MLNGSVVQRTENLRDLIPTLVIGLGHFGHYVALQLAARLQLAETGLQQEGSGQRLLMRPVQTNNGQTQLTHGLVRIMEVNFRQWMQSNYDSSKFLTDLDLTQLTKSTTKMPPFPREDNPHLQDWGDARSAMKKQVVTEQIRHASEPLRRHDQVLDGTHLRQFTKDHRLQMRVCLICAAREAAPAALTAEFVKVLGNLLVLKEQLVKGIELICYMGSTSRSEHIEAVNDDADYDQFLAAELDRLVPSSPSSLLRQLENMYRSTGYQVIDTCYLIDTLLANGMVAVQGRADEPDEVAVAAALTLTMFITTNSDTIIRRRVPHWDQKGQRNGSGIFSSLGVASYSIDHPKLRRLVYNQVIGDFLEVAHPIMEGEKNLLKGVGDALDDEIADNPSLEVLVNKEIGRHCEALSKQISYQAVEREAKHIIGIESKLDYTQASTILSQCDPSTRQSVQDALDKATAAWAGEMASSAILVRLRQRANMFSTILRSTLARHRQELYESENAHFIRVHRFLMKSLQTIEQEATKYRISLSGTQNRLAQNQLAQDQEDVYQRTLGEKVTLLQAKLRQRPSRSAALGRAALITPLMLILFVLLTKFFPGQLSGTSLSFDAAISAFLSPLAACGIAGLLMLTVLFYLIIFTISQELFQNNIRRVIRQLEEQRFIILQNIDYEAWRAALTEVYAWLDTFTTQRIKPLSIPGGVMAQLRNEVLKDETIAPGQILEHVFFNEQLRQELKVFSKQISESGILWNEREHLLFEIVEGRLPADKDKIGQWLHAQVESLYRNDRELVTHLVNNFLENQTAQRFYEIWDKLSSSAVPLLSYSKNSQEDLGFDIELFSAHDLQQFEEISSLARHAQIEVLESADRLRWSFLRVHAGLSSDNVILSAMSFL